MPSLLGTTVTANYLKTAPTWKLGTRELRFLQVKIAGGGGNNLGLIDFTKQQAASNNAVDYNTTSGSFSDSDSWFSAAVRAVQVYGELYYVGEPDADEFVVLIADDTGNGADSGNTQGTGFGLMEADVVAALSNKINGGTIAVPTYPAAGEVVATVMSVTKFVGSTLTFA